MYRRSLHHKDYFSTTIFILDVFTKFVFMSIPISGKHFRNGRHIICTSMILNTPCSLACADAAFCILHDN